MSSSGNGQRTYHVSISQELAKHIKQILEKADKLGLLDSFVSALKEINRRLQFEPDVFGEPIYFLKSLGLHMRVGTIWPLSVVYGLNSTAQLVFVATVNNLMTFD
jgi:hypothetical protein